VRWFVVAVVLAVATPAIADPGDARFAAATQRAGGGDLAGAVTDFEAIAAELPGSPWADDALVEAGRIAIRLGDVERARRDLSAVIERYADGRAARAARVELARLDAATGGGAWVDVAAAHDAVVAAVGRYGDPRPHLERLEALLREHPAYPRGAAARIWLGDRWAQQGAWDRALRWFRDAGVVATEPAQRRRAAVREIEALTALERFGAAEAAIGRLAADPSADPLAIARVRDGVQTGRERYRIRVAAWIVLGAMGGLALFVLWRATGGVAAAARRLIRPPTEVIYAVPVATIVIAASTAGNRLVGRAVLWISIGGLLIAWLSGAALGAATARGPIAPVRAIAHAAGAALAVAALAYLAIVDDRLIDMVRETWKHGPDPFR
jgi:hypothetical protein